MRRKRNGLWNSNWLVPLFVMCNCVIDNCVAEESHYFTSSDGMRLHYITDGTGETLLFVPGWLMPAGIWRHQIEYFAHNYHVIAFDPRSQGESQVTPSGNNIRRRAEDLNDLIEHIQARRVVIIGWSLGVLETLLYIRTHGDAKVAALVFVDNSVGRSHHHKLGPQIEIGARAIGKLKSRFCKIAVQLAAITRVFDVAHAGGNANSIGSEYQSTFYSVPADVLALGHL
jgi:pimeloyl-ACP methyl ester carboxylesterase